MSVFNVINGSLGFSTMKQDYTPTMELEKEDFLELLVTQLKNQNPWEPLSNQEYISQMSQFSMLEQSRNMNANLAILQMYQASLNNVQAVSLIGMTIKVAGDTITLKDGQTDTSLMYNMDDEGAVTVEIYNEDGEKVATKELGTQASGEHEYHWDGTDEDGNELPDGKYSFKVKVADEDGEKTELPTFIRGEITGVSFKDNITYLMVGGKEYPLSSILEILSQYKGSEDQGSDTGSEEQEGDE